jgi:hypothetical protein
MYVVVACELRRRPGYVDDEVTYVVSQVGVQNVDLTLDWTKLI